MDNDNNNKKRHKPNSMLKTKPPSEDFVYSNLFPVKQTKNRMTRRRFMRVKERKKQKSDSLYHLLLHRNL